MVRPGGQELLQTPEDTGNNQLSPSEQWACIAHHSQSDPASCYDISTVASIMVNE